jgi:hypothetical protein
MFKEEELAHVLLADVPEDRARFWAVALYPNKLVAVRDTPGQPRQLLFLRDSEEEKEETWARQVGGILQAKGIKMRSGNYEGHPYGSLTVRIQ